MEKVKCAVCDQQGPKEEVIHHYLEVHCTLQTVPFQCGKCGQRFRSHMNARGHLRTHQLPPLLNKHFYGTRRTLPYARIYNPVPDAVMEVVRGLPEDRRKEFLRNMDAAATPEVCDTPDDVLALLRRLPEGRLQQFMQNWDAALLEESNCRKRKRSSDDIPGAPPAKKKTFWIPMK